MLRGDACGSGLWVGTAGCGEHGKGEGMARQYQLTTSSTKNITKLILLYKTSGEEAESSATHLPEHED